MSMERTEKFNLSSKLEYASDGFCGDNSYDYLYKEDVKEFIRLLKKNLCLCDSFNTYCDACNEIDKLAGEDLIK